MKCSHTNNKGSVTTAQHYQHRTHYLCYITNLIYAAFFCCHLYVTYNIILQLAHKDRTILVYTVHAMEANVKDSLGSSQKVILCDYLHTSRFMIFLSNMSINLPGVATTMCTPLQTNKWSWSSQWQLNNTPPAYGISLFLHWQTTDH